MKALDSKMLRSGGMLFQRQRVRPSLRPQTSQLQPVDVDETSRTEDLTNTSISSSEDRMFELLDVSVKFPEGQLTVVTGPTASGKTALLVRSFSIVLFN
jgi:excinuclease UvrABC ATPase subunit